MFCVLISCSHSKTVWLPGAWGKFFSSPRVRVNEGEVHDHVLKSACTYAYIFLCTEKSVPVRIHVPPYICMGISNHIVHRRIICAAAARAGQDATALLRLQLRLQLLATVEAYFIGKDLRSNQYPQGYPQLQGSRNGTSIQSEIIAHSLMSRATPVLLHRNHSNYVAVCRTKLSTHFVRVRLDRALKACLKAKAPLRLGRNDAKIQPGCFLGRASRL
jgi:hypothetical protein